MTDMSNTLIYIFLGTGYTSKANNCHMDIFVRLLITATPTDKLLMVWLPLLCTVCVVRRSLFYDFSLFHWQAVFGDCCRIEQLLMQLYIILIIQNHVFFVLFSTYLVELCS